MTATGTKGYAHAIVVPERSDEGNEDGVLAILADTTELEINRQQLQESLREIGLLKSALDAHAIVAFTNAQGVITKVNDRFCKISKYPRNELLGKTHSIINSGYHSKEFFQDLWRTISGGEIWNGEICNKAKDGSLYWVQTTIFPFTGKNGLPEQYVAIRADITKRKRAEEEAQRLALHDVLTGLPNRRLMMERLTHAIQSSARKKKFGAVLMMDLDSFKEVNDTLGHAQGDELLRQVSGRLVRCVRQSDTVARLGGDEFVVILEELGADIEGATTHASDIGEKIRAELNKSYQLHNQYVDTSVSIGVVLFCQASDYPDELLKQADMALYKAKDAGRNQLCFFDPSLQADITERANLLRELRQAVELEQFQLHYQPVVDAHWKIHGVEALLRWRHPERG